MLLLDEPTTFLDLRYQVELLDLVRDLADAGGVAIGLVLHDLDQAAAVADELVLLDEGRVAGTVRPPRCWTPRCSARSTASGSRWTTTRARAPCAPARSAGTPPGPSGPLTPPRKDPNAC